MCGNAEGMSVAEPAKDGSPPSCWRSHPPPLYRSARRFLMAMKTTGGVLC